MFNSNNSGVFLNIQLFQCTPLGDGWLRGLVMGYEAFDLMVTGLNLAILVMISVFDQLFGAIHEMDLHLSTIPGRHIFASQSPPP